MPVLGITHAAHSAVIKTPDFPQDSSPPPRRWKGNTRVEKSSPPLPHLGRKTIFLDRLNETMTAVSREEREERGEGGGEDTTEREQKKVSGKWRGGRARRFPPRTHFSSFSHSHPMSGHQTLTLLSKKPAEALIQYFLPRVAVIRRNCSPARSRHTAGRMTAAASNANVLWIITDTASSLLLSGISFPS